MDALTLVQAILPSLCVSLLMMVFNRKQAKTDAEVKKKEEHKRDGEQVQLELLLATAKLSYAITVAVKNNRINGEVDEGMRQYRKAMDKFKAFERSLVVEKSTQS